MPAIGYGLGSFFADMIDAYDHWVTFILLGAIGLNMIKESFEDQEHCDASMRPYTMLMLLLPPVSMPWPSALPLPLWTSTCSPRSRRSLG